MTTHDEDGTIPDMTNKEMFMKIMDEVVAIRLELKQDIHSLDTRHMAMLLDTKQQLGKKIDYLTYKVDQNTVSLMANINDHDRRITKLEATAAA